MDACVREWRVGHFKPLLGYDWRTQLVLSEEDEPRTRWNLSIDSNGPGGSLNGRPVEPGATLELQIADGRWLAVYCSWDGHWLGHPGEPELGFEKRVLSGNIGLAFSDAARRLLPGQPNIHFWMPVDAILRWPAEPRPVGLMPISEWGAEERAHGGGVTMSYLAAGGSSATTAPLRSL